MSEPVKCEGCDDSGWEDVGAGHIIPCAMCRVVVPKEFVQSADALQKQAGVAHDQMQTWFSSEYIEHPETKKLETARTAYRVARSEVKP